MESRKMVSRALLLSLAALLFAVPVLGQANAGKAVIYIGGSFSKALPDGAKNGFFGLDVFAGKMVTNKLCLGAQFGFDTVHYYKYTVASSADEGGGDFTQRITVIPILFKARYYHSFSTMFQVHAQVGAGVYNTISRLGGECVGGVCGNDLRPGASLGIGFDYWFLLTTGVTFEFEYHAFTTEGDAGTFDYVQLRVDYSIIKF